MTIYEYGARKEQNIAKKARDEGKIAFRSAGSHSPIDVCIIDKKERTIKLIQCKRMKAFNGGINPKLKEKLEKENADLNGIYLVTFTAQ